MKTYLTSIELCGVNTHLFIRNYIEVTSYSSLHTSLHICYFKLNHNYSNIAKPTVGKYISIK